MPELVILLKKDFQRFLPLLLSKLNSETKIYTHIIFTRMPPGSGAGKGHKQKTDNVQSD
jgi:hypothetical protein